MAPPARRKDRSSEGCRRQPIGGSIGRATVTVDAEKQEARLGNRVIAATMFEGPRNQLVGETWNSTAALLEAGAAIETTVRKASYVAGW